MILHMESPKETTEKLLELIHKSNKVAVYKIDIQKSIIYNYILQWTIQKWNSKNQQNTWGWI